MTSSLSSREELATGFNNAAGLEALYLISPPLFSDYSPKGGILTEWFDGEEEERDGSGALQTIGLPYVIWRLFNLSVDEFTLLVTYTGNVTLRTYNKTTNAYTNYNAVMELPIGERKWDDGHDQWEQVGVVFWGLEAL